MKFLTATAAAALATSSASAAVLPVTGVTLTNGNPAVVDSDDTNLVDVTVASGTVGTLAAGVSATGNVGSSSLNIRGANGTALPNPQSFLNLDLSRGAGNAGPSLVIQMLPAGSFNPTGAAGDGNDFFLFDLGGGAGGAATGNDRIGLQAVDAAGNVIGDRAQVIELADYGDTGVDHNFVFGNGGTGTNHILGFGVDLTDFDSSGSLSGATGIRLTSTGNIDLLSAAYNTSAVPEPGSAALALAGLGLLAARRRAGARVRA